MQYQVRRGELTVYHPHHPQHAGSSNRVRGAGRRVACRGGGNNLAEVRMVREWFVWCPAFGQTEAGAYAVVARNAMDAARMWANAYDARGSIEGYESRRVADSGYIRRVFVVAAGEPLRRVKVGGASVRQYWATAADDDPRCMLWMGDEDGGNVRPDGGSL